MERYQYTTDQSKMQAKSIKDESHANAWLSVPSKEEKCLFVVVLLILALIIIAVLLVLILVLVLIVVLLVLILVLIVLLILHTVFLLFSHFSPFQGSMTVCTPAHGFIQSDCRL